MSERQELTIAELSEIYVTETLATAKETSVRAAQNNIDNHLKPLLGSRRASTITRVEVEQLLRDVASGKTARKAKKGGAIGSCRVCAAAREPPTRFSRC
jgi:hypothetical protein